MIQKLKNGLAWAALLVCQMVCGSVAAQDVDINFETLAAEGKNSPYSINGVTFTYIGYQQGANIYLKESDGFSLKVASSNKKIVRIEFKGEIAGAKYNDEIAVRNANGKLVHMESGTFVWEGSTTTVQFWGNSATTCYYVKGLRLWFEGSEIITDEKAVCKVPTVTVENGEFVFACDDKDATYHYSVTPKTGKDGVTFESVSVKVYATAPGKDPSEAVEEEFPMELLKVE